MPPSVVIPTFSLRARSLELPRAAADRPRQLHELGGFGLAHGTALGSRLGLEEGVGRSSERPSGEVTGPSFDHTDDRESFQSGGQGCGFLDANTGQLFRSGQRSAQIDCSDAHPEQGCQQSVRDGVLTWCSGRVRVHLRNSAEQLS